MKNQAHILVSAIIVAILSCTIAFADVPATTGAISKVTVYRGQALITRSIIINLPSSASELIVKDLPAMIVPESIYAQSSDDIKVLSVRYRQRAVREATREEVKKLDAEIEDVTYKLKCAERDFKHYEQYGKMYEELKDFTITAAKSDLDRGLLIFEPIEKLTGLIEDKSFEYHKRTTELEDKIADLQEDMELLKRRRSALMAGHSRTEREAVLFLSGAGGKKVSLEFNYLVNGANWQQQYNLRANPEKSNVLIEYNAVVNQTSGEDWNGVALSLSTAEPSMVAYSRGRRDNSKRGIAANEELNRLATQNQAFILNVGRSEVREFQQKIAEITRTEGISVTYELPGKLTLPSRSDQQLVTITSITAKADFTLIAMPLITDYVYLQAELINNGETVFLPGQASIFRNGEFVGKSQLPPVTVGEKFTAGFGIDSQVQVARELEDKKTRIQGGNRIDTYHYRIALSNYKNTGVELRLLDRLPYTDNSSIKIEIDKTEPQLSKDSEYLRTSRKKGILRWDLELVPNTVDRNATVVKYSYTMEYDKNMQIHPLSGH